MTGTHPPSLVATTCNVSRPCQKPQRSMVSSLAENHCSRDYKTLLGFTVHVTTMSWVMCIIYFTAYIYYGPYSSICGCVYSVTESCLTLCSPMDCSSPGSSVHGTLQARILEWVAMPSSRGSSQPKDWTQVSCTAGKFFTHWTTWEAHPHPCCCCCC